MLEWLLVIAFTGHLIAVNLAAAGPLLCVAVEWRGTRRGDPEVKAVGRRMAVFSLMGFALGIAIGGALLAILWYTDRAFWGALARVPAYRWWFFGGEVVFYFACMIPYVLLWDHASGPVATHVGESLRDSQPRLGETRPRGRWWHRLLAVFAATNLLYHFPPLFTMLSLMSTRPELAGDTLDRSLYVALFTDAETLARVAHHWLSSLATTGVALMLIASRCSQRAQATEHDTACRWATTFGARVALIATMLQAPIGLWLLLVSPAGVQSQLLGGEITSTALFGSAIVAMLLLVQKLAAAAFGDSAPATAFKSALFLLAVLLLMSGVLHRTRSQVRSGEKAKAHITERTHTLST